MTEKLKYELEFPVHASPQLLYNYLSTPSGLSEWFADNVNSRGEIFKFIWDGTEEQAKLITKKSGERIKFKWLVDEDDPYYFEIKIQVDEITKDVSIIVIDFAEEDEVEEAFFGTFFMINFNGTLQENTTVLNFNNRGYAYGDALFETIKSVNAKLLFLEAHYFRLMASMRIMRMEIPMHFTMEFFDEQIKNTLKSNNLLNASARVKINVHRAEGGLYLPSNTNVGFIISVKAIDNDFYLLNTEDYQVDLFKDFYISPNLLSTLKTNNKAIHIVGSIFAKENNFSNCLLLNTNKSVVEALNGNLFLVNGNTIKTPPLSDGCLKGIMRQQIMNIIELLPEYTLEETSISPFELQKADELFLTNVITGIQPISKYRKKTFSTNVAKLLLQKLNVKVRLG